MTPDELAAKKESERNACEETHFNARPQIDMRGICQSNSAYKGMHEPYVEGTPRSAMTWYVCRLCGRREPRGQGLFYGRPTMEAPTLEQRVKKLEDAMKSSNEQGKRH